MAKKLTIPKQQFPTSVADAYNGLLGIDTTRVIMLPLARLDEVDEQPFPINDSKVDQIADSIENVGVIEPVIVVRDGERYRILSGRHRFRACQKLGKEEIPCYIKETDDTTARYILIATNTDRNNEYSPIVYARAYAEQIELMKKLGKKSVVNAIAEQNGINRKQIYRYLRLNHLIPEIQKWVEDKILTIEAAVELSFLSEEKQLAFYLHLNSLGIAENVISRTFKVEKTKNIRQAAEAISDEDFSANIDKIIFGRYGQERKTETVEADVEPETDNKPETIKDDDSKSKIEPSAEPAEEQIAAQPEEPVSAIDPPLPKKEKTGLQAPKPDAEKAPVTPVRNSEPENTFEEIVKGYMLLALLEHGMDSESISLSQINITFDRYTKLEAAEMYRYRKEHS